MVFRLSMNGAMVVIEKRRGYTEWVYGSALLISPRKGTWKFGVFFIHIFCRYWIAKIKSFIYYTWFKIEKVEKCIKWKTFSYSNPPTTQYPSLQKKKWKKTTEKVFTIIKLLRVLPEILLMNIEANVFILFFHFPSILYTLFYSLIFHLKMQVGDLSKSVAKKLQLHNSI